MSPCLEEGPHGSCCSIWPLRIPALPCCHIALRAQRPLHDSYPKSVKTIGDHIRKRRLDLGLLQSEIARQIGVCTSPVCNWEGNESTPVPRFMPAIHTFLGYDPAPKPLSLADRIRLGRRALGLSQRQLAARLAVDPATIRDWETGRNRPSCRNLRAIALLFGSPKSYVSSSGGLVAVCGHSLGIRHPVTKAENDGIPRAAP
jgi:transcriptional regulator with XRE-family HTH domain